MSLQLWTIVNLPAILTILGGTVRMAFLFAIVCDLPCDGRD